MMKRGLFGLLVFTAFITLTFSNSFSSGKVTYTGPPIKIRLSLHVPATHSIWKDLTLPWAKMVERESNGKLIIKPYLGRVLHSPRDGFKAVRGDVTDMTMCYPIWEPGGFHLNLVFGLPFAFPSASITAFVGEELYPKYLKEEYERKGVYLAFLGAIAPYNIFTVKPVRNLEDLKGLKIRAPAGPFVDMAKNLGAVPVSMTIAEVYTALQRGIIDGVFTPDFGADKYKFYEITKYMTVLNIGVSPSHWGLNRKTFDALPQDLKRLFYNLLRIESQFFSQGFDKQNGLSRENLARKGVEVIHLEPEELERWKSAVKPIWESFVEKNEKLGLPAKKLVDSMKSLSEKYSEMGPEQLMRKVKEDPIQGIIDF